LVAAHQLHARRIATLNCCHQQARQLFLHLLLAAAACRSIVSTAQAVKSLCYTVSIICCNCGGCTCSSLLQLRRL
jgi:hypothetical protein